MLDEDFLRAKLSETEIRYSLEVCGLCGIPVNKETSYFVEVIGYVCACCYAKTKTYLMYKCMFCQSAGFGDKKSIAEQYDDILLLLSCPQCHEPLNKLPL